MRVQTRSFQKGDVMGQAWLPSHHMQNQHAKFSAEGGVEVGGGVAFRWGWWTEMSQPLFFFSLVLLQTPSVTLGMFSNLSFLPVSVQSA